MSQQDLKQPQMQSAKSQKNGDRRNPYASPFFWISISAGIFYLLIVGKDLLIPLVMAVFIWYLINALSKVYKEIPLGKNRTIPNALAFIAALLTIAGFIYFVINLISNNIEALVRAAPVYQRNLEFAIARLFSFMKLQEPMTMRSIINDINLTAIAPTAAREITGFLGRGGIVLIYVLFIFLEQRSFASKFIALIKTPKRQKEVLSLINRIDSDIRLYIGIKTLASLVTGLLSYFLFSIVGLDFASFWAFTIFLLNYIPTIGSIIATIFPSLLALMQFESLTPFFIVIIGVTAIQQLIGTVLEPRFMGDRLNLSPLVILLSLALWNRIWGVPGMLICVPITSIAMIILSHFPQTKSIAIALSRNGILEERKSEE